MAKVLIVTNFGRSLLKMRGPLLKALTEAGHEVLVAAPPEDSNAVTDLNSVGVKMLALPVDRTGANPLRDLQYLARIWRFVRDVRPDKLLAISSKPVVYAGIAGRLAGGVPTFSIISGLGYVFSGRSLKQRLLAVPARLLYRMGLRRNVAVFFQNEDDLEEFVAQRLMATKRQGVIMNGDGVDLNEFRPAPLPGRGNVLLIARLLRDKGVVEFADAARLVRQKLPNVRFRLVGWFDDNPNAVSREEVDRWVDEGVIEFLGFQADVRAAIADCDVYVLPSYREGLSRTVCEAMAMGRAIITTDAPGCRQTVAHGRNGYVVPVADATALADAIEALLRDPAAQRRMGAESRRIAEERFDVARVNAGILDVMFADRSHRGSGVSP